MDGIYYEKILNRIIQGRLRIRLDDLVLFISEPDRHIIEESFDIYEEARKKAYAKLKRKNILKLIDRRNTWIDEY